MSEPIFIGQLKVEGKIYVYIEKELFDNLVDEISTGNQGVYCGKILDFAYS